MKKLTRILSLLLACIMIVSAIPFAAAAGNFSGVKDWFKPNLTEMQQLDLIPETFSGMNLSNDITRGEMCELAVHALEKVTGYEIEPERMDYFSDTGIDYIVKAYELGIVSGYPDGTFKPNNYLTRQEFFQIMENFCNAAAFLPTADSTYLAAFSDANNVAYWAEEATQICVKYGYVNGRGYGDKAYLEEVMTKSAERAAGLAARTMLKVRRKVGLAALKL